VVAWDQGFTVVLVSIRPEGESFGRSTHTPKRSCAIALERQRESIVAMGGWAAEHASGEAGDRTYDGGDLSWVLSSIAAHAPTQVAAELGWAESEAERIVRANIERVERLEGTDQAGRARRRSRNLGSSLSLGIAKELQTLRSPRRVFTVSISSGVGPVSLGSISLAPLTRNASPPHVTDENPDRETKDKNGVDC
jgi:hypothetical protein